MQGAIAGSKALKKDKQNNLDFKNVHNYESHQGVSILCDNIDSRTRTEKQNLFDARGFHSSATLAGRKMGRSERIVNLVQFF